MASLATEFSPSRRRDRLTWSHHAAVASLAHPAQDAWLDRAELLKLSVADLRAGLRADRVLESGQGQASAAPANSTASGADTLAACPNCGHVLPSAAPPAERPDG